MWLNRSRISQVFYGHTLKNRRAASANNRLLMIYLSLITQIFMRSPADDLSLTDFTDVLSGDRNNRGVAAF